MIKCPEPPIPSSVQISCFPSRSSPISTLTPYPLGIVCTFDCERGHELQGASSITCQNEGQWSSAPPTCTGIQDLKNFLTCFFLATFVLHSINFFCNLHAHCLSPTAVTCPLLEAPENGHISCSNPEPTFNSKCSFKCDQDFTLKGLNLVTCDVHGNWTAEKPSCQGKSSTTKLKADGY